MTTPAPPTADPTRLRRAFARLAEGDPDALETVYDLTAPDLYGLALWRTRCAAEAADAVQEVFVRLATTGADLAAVTDPRAYLLTMARRAAVDRLRSRRPGEPLTEAHLLEAETPDPRRALDAAAVSRQLRHLPAAQREVVYLRTCSGLTFRQIGSILDISTFTAASRYRLAVARLRRLLGVSP